MRHELYTDQQLLKRTIAIFDGALDLYNDIVLRRFRVFNRRHQMSLMLPLRLEGLLCIGRKSGTPERNGASLVWWPRLVNDKDESSVFFELGTWDQIHEEATNRKLQSARSEFLSRRGRFGYTIQMVRAYEPRPATKLAHDWLTSELRELQWL